MNFLYSISDDVIVSKIVTILIEEYGNYKDTSALEKFVLNISRKPYLESLNEWSKNYRNIDKMPIILNPLVENVVVAAEKKLTFEEGWCFRNLFEELTYIGYMNLQIYYLSAKKYIKENGESEITNDMLNKAKADKEFVLMKEKLYQRENNVKDDIRKMFRDKRLKYSLAFYSFAFDFLDSIRRGIIERDKELMKKQKKDGLLSISD